MQDPGAGNVGKSLTNARLTSSLVKHFRMNAAARVKPPSNPSPGRDLAAQSTRKAREHEHYSASIGSCDILLVEGTAVATHLLLWCVGCNAYSLVELGG